MLRLPGVVAIQRFIVPWRIAHYGLSYPKKLTLPCWHAVKEMAMALGGAEGLLQGSARTIVHIRNIGMERSNVCRSRN